MDKQLRPDLSVSLGHFECEMNPMFTKRANIISSVQIFFSIIKLQADVQQELTLSQVRRNFKGPIDDFRPSPRRIFFPDDAEISSGTNIVKLLTGRLTIWLQRTIIFIISLSEDYFHD